MLEFTHKNHYKFGWGSGTYNFHEKDSGPYWTTYGPAEYEPGPNAFKTECLRAAKLLADSAKKPLAVMYSGGLDSEIALRCLLEVGADVTCIVSKYNYRGTNHINSYDTDYAFDFIKKNGLKVIEVEIDIIDFLTYKYPVLADKFKCNSPTWLLHTHVLSMFPEYHVVCGGGDIQLNRYAYNDTSTGLPIDPVIDPRQIENIKMGLFVDEKSHIVAAYESAQELGTNCSLRFFRHTAELMLAWLQDTDVSHFIKNEKALSCYVRRGISQMHFLHLKPWVFHKYWPDLIPRVKYHGFELTPAWLHMPGVRSGVSHITDRPEYAEVIAVMDDVASKYSSHHCTIDVNDLYQQLLPK